MAWNFNLQIWVRGRGHLTFHPSLVTPWHGHWRAQRSRPAGRLAQAEKLCFWNMALGWEWDWGGSSYQAYSKAVALPSDPGFPVLSLVSDAHLEWRAFSTHDPKLRSNTPDLFLSLMPNSFLFSAPTPPYCFVCLMHLYFYLEDF